MPTRGIFYSVYYTGDIIDAVNILNQINGSVVSSFGNGNDQWEGLDLLDRGTCVTIGPSVDKAGVELRITVPIAHVPDDYWVSPYCAEGVQTYNAVWQERRGEPADWGVRPLPPVWTEKDEEV